MCDPSSGLRLVQPALEPDVASRGAHRGFDGGAVWAVSNDDQWPVEIGLLDDVHEMVRALVDRELADIKRIRIRQRPFSVGGFLQRTDIYRIRNDFETSPRQFWRAVQEVAGNDRADRDDCTRGRNRFDLLRHVPPQIRL